MIHIRVNNANLEPVFFTYPAVRELDEMVENEIKSKEPVYDFVSMMVLAIISGLLTTIRKSLP